MKKNISLKEAVGMIKDGSSIMIGGFLGTGAPKQIVDALVESGSGFVNYLIALGVIETIAIFVLVFAILLLGKFAPAAPASAAVEQIVSSVTMLC